MVFTSCGANLRFQGMSRLLQRNVDLKISGNGKSVEIGEIVDNSGQCVTDGETECHFFLKKRCT